MRLSFRAQGVWYDDGEKLADTRSGTCENYDSMWEVYRVAGGLDLSGVSELREVTSAQVDLNRLCADTNWSRNSRTWGDYAKATSMASAHKHTDPPSSLHDRTVPLCCVVCPARGRVPGVAVR